MDLPRSAIPNYKVQAGCPADSLKKRYRCTVCRWFGKRSDEASQKPCPHCKRPTVLVQFARRLTDEEIYELANKELSIREIVKRTSGSYSNIAAIVMHGRRFGFIKPFTKAQKSRLSAQARQNFLARERVRMAQYRVTEEILKISDKHDTVG